MVSLLVRAMTPDLAHDGSRNCVLGHARCLAPNRPMRLHLSPGSMSRLRAHRSLDVRPAPWDPLAPRILLIGASGTIGRAVAAELGARHEVIPAGRKSGDVRIDLTEPATIRAAYERVGTVDAVVCTAGQVTVKPLAKMTTEDFELGLRDKLMGQVQLVRLGRRHVADGGSFTLTGGVPDEDPIATGTSGSMVNGALNAFALAASIELDRGLRVKVVSPSVITESMAGHTPYFRGFEPVPAARAARACAKSVEGKRTAQVLRVH